MTKRIPKSKEGQDPDTHSDLYTDEDPKGTIHGLGFTDAAKAKESVAKIERSDRTHAHKVQAAIAMSQRAKVASKRAKDPEKKKNLAAAAEVYFAFIEKMKKITKKRQMKEFSEYISETSGEYEGRKVDLDNPFRLPQGSKKKFGVYVRNDKGNVIKVTFGDPNLSIKRDHEDRLKNFRARHNCDEKKDKTTPGYWSCKFWEKDSPVSKLLSKGDVTEDAEWKDKNDEREHNKLFMQSLKVMPGSPKQKKIVQQMNVLRKKNGLELLGEDTQLDERKKITHVVDRRTGESVYGPTDVADAKRFLKKQIQPNKFMIRDIKEDVQLDESIESLKGWIHPKKKKAYTTERMRPYHVEFIVRKPRDYGLNKKQILDYLEKKFDLMDAPDPEQAAKQGYEDILAGRNDIDRNIEHMAMKKGWVRVVGGKFASIASNVKLNDRQVGIILSIMEDEGLIGDAAGVYTREVGLEYYEESDRADVNARVRYYKTIEGADIQNLIKGKPRGTKRTEIGQTMAMFRGESLEISQLGEAVDQKDMLRIFNDLNKGDTIKVKFKSVMASATKNFVELVVTSGRRTVGKAKVERIILKSKKNPGGVKYYLYRRGDNVSFAMGDMAAIIDEIDESYEHELFESAMKRLSARLMKLTPVANAIAKNPQTTNLAVSLIAIPAVNAILKRANYDNLQKVIDLADFMKDAALSLGAERDPKLENTVLKYSQFLDEKVYAKSGLGKWFGSGGGGGVEKGGWDRYSTTGKRMGKCGDAEEGEPYSACLSKDKAKKLGKKKIASFVRRKRDAQDKAKRGDVGDGGKGKKPINVKTGVTDKDPKKQGIQDDWSAKYKSSIDCDNPKGFSQRAHCQGRKKRGLD